MSTSSRDQILGRVRSALAPLPKRAAYPDFSDTVATTKLVAGATDPWAAFKTRMKATNGQPFDTAAELAGWLKATGLQHGYCDPELWPKLQAAFGPEFTIETSYDRKRVDDYKFGITRAAGVIAETGSVVLKDTTTSYRLAALAPWVHIAVVSAGAIYPDVAAAVAALGSDPNVIWCTGPSKTADVEGILIQGVHGPGVQIALLES